MFKYVKLNFAILIFFKRECDKLTIALSKIFHTNKEHNSWGWLAQRESIHFIIIGFNRLGFDSVVCQEFFCVKQFTLLASATWISGNMFVFRAPFNEAKL